jgi:hypothetical protein
LHPDVRAALDAGVDVRVGWLRNDPRIRADAMALWRRLRILPDGIDPEQRADEIVVAAYIDDNMVAVGTIGLGGMAQLRCRVGMWRVVVAPEARRNHLMFILGGYARHVLEEWSLAHPEEAVLGMASVTSDAGLKAAKMAPILPTSGLMVIGYTSTGGRIRIAWFDHARV